MQIIDIITFVAYSALTVDSLFQIRHVYLKKESDDISIIGLGVRYLAIIVILYKFYTLGEWPLLLGQLLLAGTFTLYFILVLTYYKK